MTDFSGLKIDVVYTLDQSFVDCTAVSVVSLLESQQTKCHVHFVHDGDLQKDEPRLGELVTRRGGTPFFHHVGEEFPRDLPVDKHASVANYYRLAMARILAPCVQRVVYLDGDTLVRRPLDELFAIDLGETGLGAVSEPNDAVARLGLPDGMPYLNSGVLAIDMQTWRNNDTTSQLLDTASRQDHEWVYWDQDVLAVHFRGGWKRLPPEYNVNHRFFFGDQRPPLPTDDPVVVHFSGCGLKPWERRQRHPFDHEFWEFAKAIGQEGFSIEKPRKRWYKSLRFGKRRKDQKRQQNLDSIKQRKLEHEQWDRDFVTRRVPDLVVARGPFQGMRYPEAYSHGSTLVPKLLGTYEAELHDCLQSMSMKDYRLIIDIGAAEGYYAVGAARLWSEAQVVAYELVEPARRAIQSMAAFNGVGDRVEVVAECMFGDLNQQRGLIICDIEGAEESLLIRKGVAEGLAKSDLIIEAHDFVVRGMTEQLTEQFSATHHVHVVESLADTQRPEHWPVSELEGLCESDQVRALAERRPEVMRWIICESKLPFPQRRIANAA